MIIITPSILVDEAELEFSFIRAPGPGGQNVNKVATAVQLRFNVRHSAALPDVIKARLALVLASKLTQHGDIIIKASRFRTQERNKQDAINRLQQLLAHAALPPKKRKKTKPTHASVQRRLEQKKRQGKAKSLRGSKPGRED